MYFLSNRLVELARKYYADFQDVTPETANWFFETFGPGNVLQFEHLPFERFSDYETLMKHLHSDDPEKYRAIHKGTPFYFLSWLAFDIRNFEKALFYMDAAISEDIRQSTADWMALPAGSFITLQEPQLQVARRTVEMLRQILGEQIDRFNAVSGLPALTLQLLIDRFVRVLVHDTPKRSIITAWYVYLLEFKDRYVELQLRSTEGGSIAPVVTHLFRGGVIFESLLKHLYPTKDDGTQTRVLRDIFHTTAFQNDFVTGLQTSATSIREIIDAIADNSIATAFSTTAKLRNTTGHNLVWDDVFEDPQRYAELFHQEVNALLYLISVKFC